MLSSIPIPIGSVLRFAFLLTLSAAFFATSFPSHIQYFTAIGSGISGKTGFRTQFELLNESDLLASGELLVVTVDGVSIDDSVRHTWVGKSGEFQFGTNKGSFTVPGQSSLVVTLEPDGVARIGWVKVTSDNPLSAQGALQVAHYPSGGGHLPKFSHYLNHQAELLPVTGLKKAAFPIWYFAGLKNISTAFAIANLSGVSGAMELTYRPGVKRVLTLRPGEMISDYFDRFWQLAFPEIFPFELRSACEIRSQLPLGVTVFRTLQGLPISGVAPIQTSVQPNCKEGIPGQEFELAVDECIQFDNGGLELLFWNVSEDSRCPIDVVCVWEGRIRVELRSKLAGNSDQFTLSSETDEKFRVGGYTLQLVKVAPAPVSTEKLTIADYRISLLVEKIQ